MSDKKFNHVHNVWNKFEMNKMKDYHDMYLKCDVLLLVDVFEKFRNNSLKNYRLFPSHYLGAAAFTWDAMFNMTKWNSELIPDSGMFIFFEKATIGGISNRYSKANNKYWNLMTQNESKHILRCK